MTKLRLFIYHIVVFILGSVGLVVYTFAKLGSPTSVAGAGGVIAMPVIAFFYIVAFGLFCLISFLIWLIISHFRRRVGQFDL